MLGNSCHKHHLCLIQGTYIGYKFLGLITQVAFKSVISSVHAFSMLIVPCEGVPHKIIMATGATAPKVKYLGLAMNSESFPSGFRLSFFLTKVFIAK